VTDFVGRFASASAETSAARNAGRLVAARRALEQTLDGANASPLVLLSGRLRFRP
jgi:hypothetical protein